MTPIANAVPAKLRIGVMLPLTGEQKQLGAELLMGVEYALSKLSKKHRANISVMYEDDGCEYQQAKTAFLKLVGKEKVDLVIGPACPLAIAAIAKDAEKMRVPVITLLYGQDQVELNSQLYVFGYDWQKERREQRKYFEHNPNKQLVAVLVAEELALDFLKPVKQLRLLQVKTKEIAAFIKSISSMNSPFLFMSTVAAEKYPKIVTQFARLDVSMVFDAGIQQGSRAIATIPAKAAVALKPRRMIESKELSELKSYVAQYYGEAMEQPFLPALGFEAMSHIISAMKDFVDVHEAMRLFTAKPQILQFETAKEGQLFLVSPRWYARKGARIQLVSEE